VADVTPGCLDLGETARRGRDRSREPASEHAVCARWVSPGPGIRRDGPLVARPTPRTADSAVHNEPGLTHPVQVRADSVRVQIQSLGEGIGRSGPAEVAEQCEQPAPCRLGQDVVSLTVWEVDSSDFSHPCGRNRAHHGTVPTLVGRERANDIDR
jgi:hypothetical protein